MVVDELAESPGGLDAGREDELADGVAREGVDPAHSQDVGLGGQLNLGEARYSPRREASTSSPVERIHAPRRIA